MQTQLLTNGHIYTMDHALPQATALAIRAGKIIAVGSDEQIRALSGKRVDLGGRCVIPGLVDAHVHFKHFALGLSEVDLDSVPSLAEALQRVAVGVNSAESDQWIRGRGWVQDLWDGRHFPTAQQLDSVTPNNPAHFRHKSGHASWANSAAMRLAGIDRHTPDPSGGHIQRDADGNPTGIFLETAIDLIDRVMPAYSENDIVKAMRKAQQAAWAFGLVGIHDFDGRDCFRALQYLHGQGELGLRVLKNIPDTLVDHAVGVGLRSGFGDRWLRIGGVKLFADGALGPRTAYMIEPYEGEPSNYGMTVLDKEEMMEIAHKAYRNQIAVTTHAIGDRAVHDILDVYESLLSLAADHNPPALPNRIEHVQIIHPSDQQRLAQLGVVASMQPIHATSDMDVAVRNWGERTKNAYAWRTMIDSGATVVFGSDSPIESIDPIVGIHAAVTRQRADGSPHRDGWHPEQRVSIYEAVHGFTTAAAITSRQIADFGTISVGKYADLTILDSDIFSADPHTLLDTKIAATIVNGDFKYQTFG